MQSLIIAVIMMVIFLSVKVPAKYTVLITLVSHPESSHKWEPPLFRPLFNTHRHL